jgi:thiol-disulfide isomerase/thioredoxin
MATEEGPETSSEGDGDGGGDGDGESESETSSSDGGSPMGNCDEEDPGWAGEGEPGDPAPHFVTVDYQGEIFELCSLAGKPIFVDVFTGWCEPCNDIAAWMMDAGSDSNGVDELVKSAVNEGGLIWFEVMVQGWVAGNDATLQDAQTWHDAYPHPEAILVLDDQSTFHDYLGGWSYPTLRLIDHEFVFRDLDELPEVLAAAGN